MRKLFCSSFLVLVGISLFFIPTASAEIWPTIISTSVNEKNDALRYEVSEEYPQLLDSPSVTENLPLARFNTLMKSFILRKVEQFKTSAAAFFIDASPEEIIGSYEDITYTAYRAGQAQNLTSLVIADDRFFMGTAHPVGVKYYSFVYDHLTNRPIKLYHLFRGDSNYLEKFSAYATESLKFQLSEDAEDIFLPEGVAPKWYNFKNFALKETGISFFFGTYQVAPYYAGPQEMTVPYSELEAYINPNGPLGYLGLVSFAECLTEEKAKICASTP